jgi:hypothetical protein
VQFVSIVEKSTFAQSLTRLMETRVTSIGGKGVACYSGATPSDAIPADYVAIKVTVNGLASH